MKSVFFFDIVEEKAGAERHSYFRCFNTGMLEYGVFAHLILTICCIPPCEVKGNCA